MNFKLETQRGETVHAAEVPLEGDPPDVLFWNGRIFRFLRTDGVWDQKKHVYRESTAHDLGSVAAPAAAPAEGGAHGPTNGGAAAKKAKDDRQISATLTAAQAALLKRLKARGAYASPKAVIVAGLEALDEKHSLSNDALLKLLAERLGDARE